MPHEGPTGFIALQDEANQTLRVVREESICAFDEDAKTRAVTLYLASGQVLKLTVVESEQFLEHVKPTQFGVHV
jgi:hypothetical protein